MTRPKKLDGVTVEHDFSGCGKIYLTINMLGGKIREVFIQKDKAGGCMHAYSQAMARVISKYLAVTGDVDTVITAFKGIHCPCGSTDFHSCPDFIGKTIAEIQESKKEKETK